MKTYKRIVILFVLLPLSIYITSCSKSAENEHLPEYCRTYSTFMETASPDIYELVDGINRHDYLNAISEIELDFEVDEPGREIDLDGIQCFQNLTSLSLTGVSFKDISEISALKNIQEITLVNTSVVSVSSFKNLSKVKSLTITNTKTLQSVKGVGEMTKLTKLELVGNGIVDIDELSNLTNLISLDLSDNEMTYFPSISGLDSLETLNLSGNKISAFGSDLSGLANVSYLDLSNNKISNLSSFGELSNLIYLDLSNNLLGYSGSSPDFSSLTSALGLLTLHLNDNNLSDISGLGSANIPNLITLSLHNNAISDISPIATYNKLEELTLNDNELINIDNLSGMEELTYIDLSNNNITSFGGLTNLSGLVSINLFNNNISVIPLIKDDLPNLKLLDLSYNSLTDTSGVEGHLALTSLNISNNGLTELTGIKDIPYLFELTLVDDIPVACTNDVLPTDFDCIPVLPLTPNRITKIDNSFDTLPSLTDLVQPNGTFNFEIIEFGNSLEILGSFNDISGLSLIQFENLNITHIDEFSFTGESIRYLLLSGNTFTEVDFAKGMPNLIQIDISGSNVTNLSIFNGTNDNDFNNLQTVLATNISSNVVLDGAFINMPFISIIDLTNTNIISINNSFNQLNQLTGFGYTGTNLEIIVNSFNGLFNETILLGNVENDLIFTDGKLGIIQDSFNDSTFGYVLFSGQESLELNTEISNSFNATTMENIATFLDSNFKTISNSFNFITAQSLNFSNSEVETVTMSFDEAVIAEHLSLAFNNITTLTDLSTMSVMTLLLNNNQLTSVSSIQNISNLETLDISNQLDDLLVPTLLSIDGINDIPTLTTIFTDGLEIASIDGLRNLGITEFDYQSDEHNDVLITSISPTSFTGSPIEDLNLEGHVLTNVDFLDNMTSLIDLTIFTDVSDLSYLTDSVYKDTLQYLYLGTPNNIIDFSPVNGYSVLDTFAFGSTMTNEINNLDNLPSATNISFLIPALITNITNSFNTMDSMNVSDDILINFPSLLSVSNSFDMITSSSFALSGELVVVDSFNNAQGVVITAGTETNPRIDSLSFDSLEVLILNDSSYLDYSYLSDYPVLEFVELNNIGSNNLNNISSTSIIDFIVNNPSILIDNISVDLGMGSTLTVNALLTNASINTNSGTVVINSAFDVVINSTNSNLDLQGSSSNLIINGSTLNSLDIGYLNIVNNITVNADNLGTMTSEVTALPNALVIAINSNISTQDITGYSSILNINNNSLSTLNVVSSGEVNLQTNQAILDLSGIGTNLTLDDPNLLDLTHNISFGSFIIDANLLTDVNFGISNILYYSITSAATSMSINGVSEQEITLNNDNITSLNISAPQLTLDMDTASSSSLTFHVNMRDLEVIALNQTSVKFENSDLYLMSLTTNNLSSITYEDSVVINSYVHTNVSSFTANRIHNSQPTREVLNTDLTINDDNLNSLVGNVPNSTLFIDSLEPSINLIANATSVIVAGSNLTNISVDDSSDIDNFSVTNSPLLNTVTMGLSTVIASQLSSNQNSINVTSTNVAKTTISGNTFISIIADVGTNELDIISTKTTSMNLDIIADDLIIQAPLASLVFGNTSNITNLNAGSDSLIMISAGIATIDNIDISEVGNSFSIIGTSILDAYVISTGALLDFNVELDIDSAIKLSSNATTEIDITTNTRSIEVINTGAIIYSIDSSTLESANVEAEFMTFNLTKPNNTFNLKADSYEITFNGEDIENIIFDPLSRIDSLNLYETSVTNLDLNNLVVRYLTINDTNATSLTVNGPAEDTNIDAALLNSYTVTNSPFHYARILTSSSNLAVNGDFETLYIWSSLTNLDLSNADIEQLDLRTSNLAILDTSTNVTDVIRLHSVASPFDLTTLAPSIEHDGSTSDVLNITSTLSGPLKILTESIQLDISAPNAEVELTGFNISNLSGTASSFTVHEIGPHNLTLDVDASTFTFSNDTNTNSIYFIGNRTVNDIVFFTLGTSIMVLDTNSVNVDTIYFDQFTIDLLINTNANSINVANANAAIITSANTNLLLEGSIGNLRVSGENLTNIDLFNLTDVTVLEIIGTLIDNLGFITSNQVFSLNVLSIDTVDPLNVEQAITLFEGTGILLLSPITTQHILDYFEAQEVLRLTIIENNTSELYNTYKQTALNTAAASFNANQYLEYLDDTTVRNDIDNGTVKTTQEYFEAYIISETAYQNEAEYRLAVGNIAADAVYDSINDTVTASIVANIESIVFGNVNTEINIQAASNAITLNNDKGWSTQLEIPIIE